MTLEDDEGFVTLVRIVRENKINQKGNISTTHNKFEIFRKVDGEVTDIDERTYFK